MKDVGAPRLWWVLARSSSRVAAGFVIALIAGASAEKAALALAWGALLFGGSMALVYVCFLTIALWKDRGAIFTDDLPEEPFPEQKRMRFVDFVRRSWRTDAVVLAVFVLLAALVDPLNTAFVAGYGVGLWVISIPALFGSFGLMFGLIAAYRRWRGLNT